MYILHQNRRNYRTSFVGMGMCETILNETISWPSQHGIHIRPLAGYGLPPPKGNFVDHIFLKAQCLARILQHVSPLTMATLSCNSLLHTLPYKVFDE